MSDQENYDQDVEHEEVEPVQEEAEESELQTSQPDVPVEAPESVPVAEGSTVQSDPAPAEEAETEPTPEDNP